MERCKKERLSVAFKSCQCLIMKLCIHMILVYLVVKTLHGDARGAVVDSDLSPGTGPRACFCHSTSGSDVHLQEAEPECRLKGVCVLPTRLMVVATLGNEHWKNCSRGSMPTPPDHYISNS